MLYFQAIEFVAFHIKLKNSSQYLISKLDSFILNLKISANNLDELEVNFLVISLHSYHPYIFIFRFW